MQSSSLSRLAFDDSSLCRLTLGDDDDIAEESDRLEDNLVASLNELDKELNQAEVRFH